MKLVVVLSIISSVLAAAYSDPAAHLDNGLFTRQDEGEAVCANCKNSVTCNGVKVVGFPSLLFSSLKLICPFLRTVQERGLLLLISSSGNRNKKSEMSAIIARTTLSAMARELYVRSKFPV